MENSTQIFSGLEKAFLLTPYNLLVSTLSKLRNRHFLVIDTLVFAITPFLALSLRLDDFSPLEAYKSGLFIETLLFLLIKLSILYSLGFYRRYWRYASIDELVNLAMMMSVTIVMETLLYHGLSYITGGTIYTLPRSVPLLDGLLSFLIVGGLRFAVRLTAKKIQGQDTSTSQCRVLIIGAGSAGISLVRNLQADSRLGLCPIAFIDDDPEKQKMVIMGLHIYGDRHKIPSAVESLHISRIIIAIPSAPGSVIREIVEIAQTTRVQTITLPGLSSILNGRVQGWSLRNIQIEDLLRREPIKTDFQKIVQLLGGKRVLITGAGGSIGSELCRQILRCRPAAMFVVGKGENSIFYIEQELQKLVALLKQEGEIQGYTPQLETFIADIRSTERLEYIFDLVRPEIVFHAAAHKHVPLMELNAPEAITSNVIGTKNLLDMAQRYSVDHFVMISTDKAVNPTNVMGASKRVGEMLVLQAAKKTGKPYVVVRFGNVLGSRGSVVPTFQSQIAVGGPITITHPEICRYFMTIPEAVQLVLQAALLSHGGEVMMFDMGKPIKIADLAKDMIRLSGYEVGKDIDIVFTGLRPGEKLFEELFVVGEQYERTQHEKILIAHNASQRISVNLDRLVQALSQAAERNDSDLIRFLLEQLVEGYTPKPSNVIIRQQTQLITREDLYLAIARQEFRLHYQPIVFLETAEIIGFEALLRWQHPELGILYPSDFMEIAEKAGLSIPMGGWIMRQVCLQLRNWQEQFLPQQPIIISVNLSRSQLLEPDLAEGFAKILQEINVSPKSLRLEISETILTEDFNPQISLTLSQLKDLGFLLQLENVGLGDSSLKFLNRLPILLDEKFTSLKVDSSIIRQIEANQENQEFFLSMMAIIPDLGIEVAAAGIEKSQELTQLQSMKCKYGQGWLFSKPRENLIEKNNDTDGRKKEL